MFLPTDLSCLYKPLSQIFPPKWNNQLNYIVVCLLVYYQSIIYCAEFSKLKGTALKLRRTSDRKFFHAQLFYCLIVHYVKNAQRILIQADEHMILKHLQQYNSCINCIIFVHYSVLELCFGKYLPIQLFIVPIIQYNVKYVNQTTIILKVSLNFFQIMPIHIRGHFYF